MASSPAAAGDPAPKAKDPDLVEFGARLRGLRLAAALTQEDLAHQAGLHWTYVGQIERGERNLTYKNLLRLAHGLDVAPAGLVPSERRVPFSPEPELSPQQVEIVTLLGEGLELRVVAERMDMTLPILRRSLREAREAMGASNTQELLALLAQER